jgi:hypothetical protein
MKQRLVIILALTLIAKISFSQIIDRYGINIGTSYSTQVWDYKLVPIDSDYEYKFGFMAFLQAEKDFGNLLALRTELGYIQKGFKNNIELLFVDGTSVRANNDNVILHDLALNLGLKIRPVKADYTPYLLVGLRSDYLISYKDIVIEVQEIEFNMFESTIEDFNKFNLGGLIGLGIEIKDLIYCEIEYNPNITKNFEDTGLSIKDNCWGAKIGLNINKLTE